MENSYNSLLISYIVTTVVYSAPGYVLYILYLSIHHFCYIGQVGK